MLKIIQFITEQLPYNLHAYPPVTAWMLFTGGFGGRQWLWARVRRGMDYGISCPAVSQDTSKKRKLLTRNVRNQTEYLPSVTTNVLRQNLSKTNTWLYAWLQWLTDYKESLWELRSAQA